MVKNRHLKKRGSKWSKIVKIKKNHSQNWAEMVKNGQIGQTLSDWSKMVTHPP